jgi:hypothetical protein
LIPKKYTTTISNTYCKRNSFNVTNLKRIFPENAENQEIVIYGTGV